MGFYLLLLLFAGLFLFWFVLNNPAPKSAAVLTTVGPFILMVVGALLTFFRHGMIGLPLIFLSLSCQHATAGVSAVGCFDAEDGPDAIPYQIIDLTLDPQ